MRTEARASRPSCSCTGGRAIARSSPRRQFIAQHLFLPTSDRRLVEEVLAVMLAAPSHVAASAMRGILAFDGPAVAAQCHVPALHLAATPPLNPPHLMAQWLPTVVNG